MKKIVLFGLVCSVVASNANAGWFGNLFTKNAEPQTLSEACNADEITSVCPEMVLGEKTLTECLSENVKSLSKKCSKYVKKSIKENKELILESKDAAATAAGAKVADVKTAIAEKKVAASEAKTALKNKKAALKSDAKIAGQEIKETVQTIKADAIETDKSVKAIAK